MANRKDLCDLFYEILKTNDSEKVGKIIKDIFNEFDIEEISNLTDKQVYEYLKEYFELLKK